MAGRIGREYEINENMLGEEGREKLVELDDIKRARGMNALRLFISADKLELMLEGGFYLHRSEARCKKLAIGAALELGVVACVSEGDLIALTAMGALVFIEALVTLGLERRDYKENQRPIDRKLLAIEYYQQTNFTNK